MKKEDIICLPHADLRQKSERIHVITDEVKQLVQDMISSATDWEASRPHEISAALAAVQVDKLYRIIVVRSDFDNKNNKDFIALINPEITKYEGEIESDYEGCLSVKDIYGKVPRHTKVRVKAIDIDGNEIRLKTEGFLARVLQHEIDHTNGLVFIDRIKDDADAFYQLKENGDLEKINYESKIKNNRLLWD